MALRIYNTRTRRKAAFRPRDVRMYVCGPTVYAPAHMGHARSYVAFDVVRRYLEFRGHRVRLVVNLTDVEDAVAKRAAEVGVPWRELADRYAHEFLEDMRTLHVKDADAYPRVSDHIPEILAVARDLVASGKAYVQDGSVYLDTKGKGFGSLSHVDPGEAIVPSSKKGKRKHPLDFAIWRRGKPGGPAWDSPWGPGYPGWHVECYAMAAKHLGRVDLHGGGRDLVFPHHESEDLLARAHAGHPMASVWMHNGWLTLEWEKMSKSLGNVLPIREVLRKWPAEVVRLCLAKTHYRENVEYDTGCFRQAAGELKAIRAAVEHARHSVDPRGDDTAVRLARWARRRVLAAMDDDFDAGAAFQAILQFAEGLRDVERVSPAGRDAVLAAARDFGDILGVRLA